MAPGDRFVDLLREEPSIRVNKRCPDCGANCGQCGGSPNGYGLVSQKQDEVLSKIYVNGYYWEDVSAFLQMAREQATLEGKTDTREYECRDPKFCEYHQAEATSAIALGPYRTPANLVVSAPSRTSWQRLRSSFKHEMWRFLLRIRGTYLNRHKMKCAFCFRRLVRKLWHFTYDDDWVLYCPKCKKAWPNEHYIGETI